MIVVVIALLIVLSLLSVRIGVAVGMATVVAATLGGMPIERLPQTFVSTLTNFPMLAIPMFIMAGKIMEVSGISQSLISFARAVVGHVKGGLAYVALVTLGLFGAISGSSIAATVAVGTILIPAMVKQGFDRSYASALHGAGAVPSGIIPPSIALVLYGVVAEVSIGDLFVAAVIPGILIVFGLALAVWLSLHSKSRSKVAPSLIQEDRVPLKGLLRAFIRAVPALLMPAIILGGIYGGFFTPTEAGAVACLYGILVGIAYRRIRFGHLGNILTSTISISSVLLFVMATAGYFGSWIAIERVPQQLTGFLDSLSLPWAATWLLIVLMLILIGMFMEASAAMIILVPILLPVATEMGMDPVQFGILIVIVLAIGLLTPPVGMQLFVASKVGNVSIESVIRPSLYFAIPIVLIAMLVLFVPQVSLILIE